jgi:ketosteroid isomerase-like protein
MKNTSADIALEFIDRINSHSVALISTLITEDHLYIDAQGNEIRGKLPFERSWRACFEWFPDYSLQVVQAFSGGNIAVVTGFATGTYCVNGRMNRDGRWRTPSAWQAVTRGNQITEWRVYADNAPIWKVMHDRRRYPPTPYFDAAGSA